MRITTHLCFDGNCRAAFDWYRDILGCSIETMLSYGESPLAATIEKQWHGRIVHATLKLDDFELTGVDTLPQDYKPPQGFFVTLSIQEPAQALKTFDALSDGAKITAPFRETFWSARFGVLIDRYAIPWEINCEQAQHSA